MKGTLVRLGSVPTLALMLVLAGCSDWPTHPDTVPEQFVVGDIDALLAQAFTDEGEDAERTAYQGVLYRILRRAREVAIEEHGEDAAQIMAEKLRPLANEVEAARAAKDRPRYRAARIALETQASKLIIRILGGRVVERVLRAAGDRLDKLTARVEAAASDGADVTRALQIVENQQAQFDQALAAHAAGDPVTALRLGARVLDSLSRFD